MCFGRQLGPDIPKQMIQGIRKQLAQCIQRHVAQRRFDLFEAIILHLSKMISQISLTFDSTKALINKTGRRASRSATPVFARRC